MCTAAIYKTKDFYFGRTLDYEFSYGDQIGPVMPKGSLLKPIYLQSVFKVSFKE